MPVKVTFTILGGALDGKAYEFTKPARCVVGRSEDCSLRLPNRGWDFHMVSRHHCQLDIEPPRIRVRDLGSRNGTYINGRLIGLRGPEQSPDSAAAIKFASTDLNDGDILEVGPVSFRVKVRSTETAQPEPVESGAESAALEPEETTKPPADWMMFAI
jgi:serine/threonine-protein kinase